MGDVVSDIKTRLSIEDVVAPYVQLKKAGRNFKACCPFHSENTPSFVVSPEKQIAYCFGCNKGGDIFKFIQEVEGCEFPEAVKILADKAGIKTDVKKFKGKGKGGKSMKEEFLEMHEVACKFFAENLFDKSDESKKVLEYLSRRGVKDSTIKEFKIGLAKDSFDGLYKTLIKNGFKQDVLIKSGLFSFKDVGGKSIYDKFRLRLIFPIFDHMGRVVGFGGRALKEDQMPKYLNSPETAIYSKGKVLYGLSHAKKAIKEADKVVIVEGYFDVISLYQEGIENIVASSGTALTPEQVRLVKRFTNNIVSCFDTDSAGIGATKRAYEVVQDFDVFVSTLKMPDQIKDPADFMVERGKNGKKQFLALIEGAEDFMEFYMKLLTRRFDVKTLDGRRKFLNEIIPLIKIAKSSVNTDHYVRILSKHLDIKEKFLYDEIENFKILRDKFTGGGSADEGKASDAGKVDAREVIIGISLEYPSLFSRVSEALDKSDFEGELKDIYIEMVRQYNSFRTKEKGLGFETEKLASISEKVTFLSLLVEEKYVDFSEESMGLEIEKLIDKMAKNRKMHQRIGLEKALKEAEEAGDEKKKKLLLEEFQKLLIS